MKKIIFVLMIAFIFLLTMSSVLALTKIAKPIPIEDPIIIKEPIIIEEPTTPKGDISNILIQNLIIYQAIANDYTKIGFEIVNNNPDAVTITVRIQPSDGISDIVYSNINLNSGQSLILNPKWIYTSAGTKNANIRVEYNSQNSDYPFQINVIAQNKFTISGKILNANTANGMNAYVYFGLDKILSNPFYSLTAQTGTNYLFAASPGFYSFSKPLTLNQNIEQNVSIPIRFDTTVLGEDGLYFMKFMTNTFNPDPRTTVKSIIKSEEIETILTPLPKDERFLKTIQASSEIELDENDVIYSREHLVQLRENFIEILKNQNVKYEDMLKQITNTEIKNELKKQIEENNLALDKLSYSYEQKDILDSVKASGILTTWKELPIRVYYNRSAAPAGYIENLTAALTNWSNAAGKPGALFVESATPISLSEKGINFFYPTACPNGGYGETYPVNSSPQGDITNVNICIRTNLGASTYRIFAHELGHGLALWSHSDDLTHLMKAGAGRDITVDEATLIRNLYNIPSLTNMDNYRIGYVNTYLKNILIYSHNTTHYNFTDRFYSSHYTDMLVCRDISCTNCNLNNKSNCVCYAENVAPSSQVGQFVTGTCQYPKTSTDPLYTKVCDRDTGHCSKMCNLQALNC